MKTWHRAVLRESLMKLPKGTVVAIRETKLVHRSIEKTYWILSIKKGLLYHVADSYAGRECRGILRVDVVAHNQERCEKYARAFKERGQYARSRRREIRQLLKRIAS